MLTSTQPRQPYDRQIGHIIYICIIYRSKPPHPHQQGGTKGGAPTAPGLAHPLTLSPAHLDPIDDIVGTITTMMIGIGIMSMLLLPPPTATATIMIAMAVITMAITRTRQAAMSAAPACKPRR